MTGSTAPRVDSVFVGVFWCCFFGGGIIGSLLAYGLVQERIMTQPYGEDRFTISAFLVWCNRCLAVVFSIAMTYANNEGFGWGAPLWKYLAISISNVSATWCQYTALLYVSFPVQMLGKSFKMMPVMVWGILISSKKYGVSDWMVAAAVTGGVTEFLLTGPTTAADPIGNSYIGFVLLGLFLALDGFTSTMQEKLFREHQVTKYNQMMYVNVFSAIVSFLTVYLMGDLTESMYFCATYPAFVKDVFVLSASSVCGQWFIYSQVKEFGALVFAATMNVRQVVSILVSYATYGNPITGLQVLGLLVVFGGLFYKSMSGLLVAEKGERQPLMKKAPEAAQGINNNTSDNADGAQTTGK